MTSFKRITLIAIAVFFSAMLCNLFGWGDDDTVSTNAYDYNAKVSQNHVWSVVANEDTAYAVWYYEVGSYEEVWFARSTDNTETWSGHTHLSSGLAGEDLYPSIAMVGDTVHVAWYNRNSTVGTIIHKSSYNKGVTWNAVDTVSDNTCYKYGAPCIRATGSYVYIAWRDIADASPYCDIFFDVSSDNGSTWGDDQNISNISGSDNSFYPSMAVNGANIDVVWEHYKSTSPIDREIYHIRNTNHGGERSWDSIHNVSDDSTVDNTNPCVAFANTFIHVVWQEDDKIWHARSSNAGANWTERKVCDTTTTQRYPNVCATGANVHVVWEDNRDGTHMDVWYAISRCNGYYWGDSLRISADEDTNRNSKFPSIDVIVDNQDSDYRNLYVVWYEDYTAKETYDEVLADYDQHLFVVEDEPESGGELISNGESKDYGYPYMQISPNPMGTKANIEFTIPHKKSVNIEVFDASGRLVKTLYEGEHLPGTYSTSWDGTNEEGKPLRAGVYFIKAKGIGESKVIKLK